MTIIGQPLIRVYQNSGRDELCSVHQTHKFESVGNGPCSDTPSVAPIGACYSADRDSSTPLAVALINNDESNASLLLSQGRLYCVLWLGCVL